MHTGISEYLSYDQRCKLVEDICTVYKYGYEGKKQLHTRSDDSLFAFRESLRKQGKISRFLTGNFSAHISVIMKKIGADIYTTDTKWIDNVAYTYFYLGLKSKKLDRIGIARSPIEIGYIKLDQNWKIIKTELKGKIIKRFNGLELIIDGKKE